MNVACVNDIDVNETAYKCDETPTQKCDTGTQCFQSKCDASDDSCGAVTPVDCDDGKACTENLCDPLTGCYYEQHTNDFCADNDPCTIDTVDCSSADGCKHENKSCTTTDVCQIGQCNPASGECEYFARDCASELNDNRACRIARCYNGKAEPPVLYINFSPLDVNVSITMTSSYLEEVCANASGTSNNKVLLLGDQIKVTNSLEVKSELEAIQAEFENSGSTVRQYMSNNNADFNNTVLDAPELTTTERPLGCYFEFIGNGVADECGICGGDNTECGGNQIDVATAAGIGAGVLAAIIIAAIVAAILMGVGTKKGLDYLKARQTAITGIQDNPLYQEQNGQTENPLYDDSEMNVEEG
jgi:hypothetical protein